MCVDNKKVPQQPKLKKVINVQYVYNTIYSPRSLTQYLFIAGSFTCLLSIRL